MSSCSCYHHKSVMFMGKSCSWISVWSYSHLQCFPSTSSLYPGRQRHWKWPAVCWTQKCSQPPFPPLQEWMAKHTRRQTERHTGEDTIKHVIIKERLFVKCLTLADPEFKWLLLQKHQTLTCLTFLSACYGKKKRLIVFIYLQFTITVAYNNSY